jgi:hypothetical protein
VAWKLTIRVGPRVEHQRFEDLDGALDALEARGRRLSNDPPSAPVDVKFKRFEPVDQVAARIELAGPQRLMPSVRAGVDIRGDGSSEAYLGRLRRQVVAPRRGETVYAALRRAVSTG